MKKAELELTLDEYISENAAKFTSDPRLGPYFASRQRAVGSPVKTGSDGGAGKLKVARRRATKATEDLANE